MDPSFQAPVKAALKTGEACVKWWDESRNVTGEGGVEVKGRLSPSHGANGEFGFSKVRIVSPEDARDISMVVIRGECVKRVPVGML